MKYKGTGLDKPISNMPSQGMKKFCILTSKSNNSIIKAKRSDGIDKHAGKESDAAAGSVDDQDKWYKEIDGSYDECEQFNKNIGLDVGKFKSPDGEIFTDPPTVEIK